MNDAQRPIMQPHSLRAYWIFQLTGWGAFTLARFIGGVTALGLPWAETAAELIVLDGLALAQSHWLRGYMRRHEWRALPLRRLILRILAAAFLIGIPLGIMTQFTRLASFQDAGPMLKEYAPGLGYPWDWSLSLGLQIVNWAFVFGLWMTIYFNVISIREHRSAQLKQSEVARSLQLAELRLLKSQLNPHFLFNALNTVRSLIADNPSRAQQAVTRLAATLRYTLASRQEEMVTLSQELAIVADYLELESMRFEDRLRIETRVPQDAAGVSIPVMLLQTLVENAIKHGIAELPEGGLVRITAAVKNDLLVLEVENPRPPTHRRAPDEGVGLRNAHDRLRLLFGERASLELDLSTPSVATARLRIPTQR
jgi:hypothetical protein